MFTPRDVDQRVKRAVAAASGRKRRPKSSDSFLVALGFDSLRMAGLTISLEEEFGQAFLLNEWLAECDDPNDLTVASLSDYVVRLVTPATEALRKAS